MEFDEQILGEFKSRVESKDLIAVENLFLAV